MKKLIAQEPKAARAMRPHVKERECKRLLGVERSAL